MLCYNGLEETTRPCLESIVANTPVGSYELVVVDNASVDGTAEYLEAFAAQHSNVRLQLNDTNKGYAGGNNDGIKLSRGRYIVLLNNDTLVPKGWLERLLRLFEQQSTVGLVGPITNSAGNEQCIELPGLSEKNYAEVAGAYIERQDGVWFTTEKLGFFCVAMRREVPEKIGYLDERFGIGMFEDDDYCVRARKAGYKLAVVEDCFVYHKGSVSFKKLTLSDYVETFNRNRSYFFEKHGTLWTYTDIAYAIWNAIYRDLALGDRNNEDASVARINARAGGMTSSLFQLREVERRNSVIGGEQFTEVQLAEKQRQLMEISDWATSLKQDNARLAGEVAAAKADLMKMSDWATSLKQNNSRLAEDAAAAKAELMKMSDWAAGMNRELEEISRSRLYRVFRYMQKRGI